MNFKDLLSKTLSAASVVGLSCVLLECPFSCPSLAMDAPPQIDGDGLVTASTVRPSLFKCNLDGLSEAQQLIHQSTFLPEPIRLFFHKAAKAYDRTQFLQLLTPEGNQSFISSLMPEPEENNVNQNPVHQISVDDTMDLIQRAEIQKFNAQHFAQIQAAQATVKQETEKGIRSKYTPHIENIKHEIETKGSLNHELFDSFFAHLLGVGKLWWVRTEGESSKFDIVVEKQHQYIYPRENVLSLFKELHHIGFLPHFTEETLLSVDQFYNPSNQFARFQKNNKEEVKQFVIAGGHLGAPGIESISKYKNNTLTIDLSPLELPDVIADINNKELLEDLVKSYEGKLDFIIDTSCCDMTFMLEDTVSSLVRLLRSGGRIISQGPFGNRDIGKNVAATYIEKYNLKPIFSETPNMWWGMLSSSMVTEICPLLFSKLDGPWPNIIALEK